MTQYILYCYSTFDDICWYIVVDTLPFGDPHSTILVFPMITLVWCIRRHCCCHRLLTVFDIFCILPCCYLLYYHSDLMCIILLNYTQWYIVSLSIPALCDSSTIHYYRLFPIWLLSLASMIMYCYWHPLEHTYVIIAAKKPYGTYVPYRGLWLFTVRDDFAVFDALRDSAVRLASIRTWLSLCSTLPGKSWYYHLSVCDIVTKLGNDCWLIPCK